MNRQIVALALVCFIGAVSVRAKEPASFTEVYSALRQKKPLPDKALGELERIRNQESFSLEDRLVSQVLAVLILSSKDVDSLTKQSIAICDRVIKDQPGSWQADYLRFARLQNYRLLAEYKELIPLAIAALKEIDFHRFDARNHEFLKISREALGITGKKVRNEIVSMLGYAYRETGAFDAAGDVYSQMDDVVERNAALQQLGFFRKKHFEASGDTSRVLGTVVEELQAQGNWKSPTAMARLDDVLKQSADTNELLTARVLWSFYQGELATSLQDSAPSMARMRDLCGFVLKEGSNTWQWAAAQFILVGECDFNGNHAKEIIMATNALAVINFEILETNNVPAWRAIRKAMGDRPYILREAFKFALANAFCAQHRLAEATQVLNTMSDKELKQIVYDGIKLDKDLHDEHERKLKQDALNEQNRGP